MDIINKIDSYAASTPNKIAFQNRNDKITYKDLKDRSNALASWLSAKLGKDNSPIIIRGHKESLMAICFLAATKSGHPYIPVDVSIPPERIMDIIENSKAHLLLNVCSDEIDLDIEVIDNSAIQNISKQAVNQFEYTTLKGDEDYYIKYTSSSTGKPKGVRITYNNLESFLTWATAEYSLQSSDIIMNQVIFSFDVSVLDIYGSFTNGGTIIAIDNNMIRKPKDLFDCLSQSKATILIATPSFVEYCLYERSFNSSMLPFLKKIILAGEALSKECVSNLNNRFADVRVYNAYGPTEATVLVSSIYIDKEMLEKESLPIGFPASHIKIIVNDADTNGRGEIIIKGQSVSPGYLNDPERTDKSFFKDQGVQCYRTGDIGYFENGILFYCGRIDNQIKLSGYRIELEDIENKISSLNYISKCVVMPKFNNGKCHSLTAFILKKNIHLSDHELSTQIKADLHAKIPQYMIPGNICFVEEFAMTANGKVDRNELKKLM